jgi:hypothetical protein
MTFGIGLALSLIWSNVNDLASWKDNHKVSGCFFFSAVREPMMIRFFMSVGGVVIR